MDDRIINLTAPLASHQPRRCIRTGQRGRKGQLLLQRRTHLLVGPQPPSLPSRTAPMLILRVLALPYAELYSPHDASQPHRLLSPMMGLSCAEGEKPRLGGQPL